MLYVFILNIVALFTSVPEEVVSGSSFIYSVEIETADMDHKNRIARYVQTFPEGIIVEEVSSQFGEFSFTNGELKYVWMFFPKEERVLLTFKVTVPDGYNKDIKTQAKFGYVKNGDQKGTNILGEEIHINVKKKGELELKPFIGTLNEPKNIVQAQYNQRQLSDKPLESVYEIEFRVQVLATNKQVNIKQFFKDNFNYELGDIVETEHEGLYKYVTLAYSTYNGAVNKRDNLVRAYDVPAPFVIAYFKGIRIPVSAALEIIRAK